MMSKSSRLHPATILIQMITMIYRYLVPLGVLVMLREQNSETEGLFWWIIGGISLLICILTWTLVTWYRYTYYVKNGEFRIEHGVWFRKAHSIPFERIQSINNEEGVLHRLFSVVKLRVETASNSDVGTELQAVSRKEAERLQTILTADHKQVIPTNNNKTDENKTQKDKIRGTYKRITLKQLFILSLTPGALFLIIPFVGSSISILEYFISVESMFGFMVKNLYVEPHLHSIVIVTSVVFAIALAISFIANMIKFGNFCVTHSRDHLILERGFFERRRSIVPLNRIQAVQIKESLFRQIFGLATVRVMYLGGGDDSNASLVVYPLLSSREIESFLQDFLPDHSLKEIKLTGIPRRSWHYFVTFDAVTNSFIAAILTYFFFPWGVWSLLFVALFFIYGHVSYRDEGWHLRGDNLVARSRLFTRSTVIVTRKRIQSSSVKQTIFQRRNDLMAFQFDVAGGWLGKSFSINHIDKKDAKHLLEWSSHRSL